jgi:putative tricarboxylic transport membrane protein
MTRADTVIGAGLAIAFLALLGASTQLTYQTEFAPGPGFAPFWLGLIGTALSGYIAVRAIRAPAAPTFERTGITRLAGAVVGLVIAVAVAERVGLIVAMTLYLLFVTLAIERIRPVTALAASLGTMALVYVVFVRLLGVPFPQGPLGL